MIPGFVAHLWQSTLFVGAVWLLTLALRKNPARVRYSVWFIASAKFLIPFSLLVGLGAFVPWRAAAPPAETGWMAVAEQVRPLVTIPAVGAEVALTATKSNLAHIASAALLLWFCGFAAITICWAARWKRIGELRRRATPLRMCKGIESAVPIMSAPGLVEPGVFGVFRPILLLPEGIVARLTEPQLDAILAHELCHVRRRDNLTATIHMAVQAVFWFHPLVWWLGARLVDERERACDEEVLRLGNRPQVYAAGILNVCKLYVESQLTCVSGVTGADLKKRIEAIMKNRVVRRLDLRRKLVLALAGIATVTIPFAIGVVSTPATLAQSSATAGKRSEFEVASIKASKPGGDGSTILTDRGGGFTTENATLRGIIAYAFGIKNSQLSGGPSWLDSDRFDIVAKPEARSRPAQVPQMVQSLLADRFKLKFHRETKEMLVLALVVGKNGPKLKPTKPEDDAARPNRGFQGRMGDMTALGADMAALAARLTAILGRPVIDRTALTGRFDFKLEWTPDGPAQMRSPDQPAADNEQGPSIFTAVQQLGLKLENQKAQVEMIVIDAVEQPSAN